MNDKDHFSFPFSKDIPSNLLDLSKTEFRQNMSAAFNLIYSDHALLIDNQYVMITRENYEKLFASYALANRLAEAISSANQCQLLTLNEVAEYFHISLQVSIESQKKFFTRIAVTDIENLYTNIKNSKEKNRAIKNILKYINRLIKQDAETFDNTFNPGEDFSLPEDSGIFLTDPNVHFCFPDFVQKYTYRGNNIIFYHFQNSQIIIDRVLCEKDDYLYLFVHS